ncbi:tripartite tricarboxylate transporter substrate-binding protein [Paeniroseomonas aquatica]|uniref:Tripartite tricarboxylate transporter substrate-binding protein n=1 Tax=Paeniroseomonas aquatica TaxID=373043 RepID=A0ABT8A4C2_9PROT|nr:tripartite tricarboxylate transporter substrate-binding protein [Paeniroseomonas aquatica]MDN3564476.1 tripartite tricarboxylate transporter substrate-binding protein [Paeniroseomonas aquatica]
MRRIIGRRSALALAAAATPALAQSPSPAWPVRPLRIIVAWPAGGSVDAPMRLVAGPVQAALGQPVVIENRAGAAGSIGAAAVAQAAPDGYTILADASTQAANPALMQGLSFDYATAFAPVTQLTAGPGMLVVRADGGPETLAALIARLRGAGAPLPYASSGTGTASHLASVILLRQAGAAAQHIPYRGSPLQVQAMLSGEVLFTFISIPAVAGLVREGRLRALAVSGARRLAGFPEVPTVAEQGFPGFALTEWQGLFVPAGTPAPIIARIAGAAHAGLRDPPVRERLQSLGLEVVGEGPAALAAFLAEQRRRLAALVAAEGIRLD